MKNLKNFTPFSDNVIFFDTEFSSLDPYVGEILSIGMVKHSGEELYLELEYGGEYSEWVQEHLLDTLTQEKVSREEAQKQVTDFVGDAKPYLVAYVNQFDVIYTYKLFGVDGHPFYWLPIDFAAILFGLGVDPEQYYKNQKEFVRSLGIDAEQFTQHHALDDARLLREVYLKLTTQN